MNDLEPTLRHIANRVEVPQPAYERMLRRRDAVQLRQRLAAGVVGVMVFAAIAAIIVPATRSRVPAPPAGQADPRPQSVGFIGLPPQGAEASSPERGELVLYVNGGPLAWTRVWVYEDGRLIWHHYGDVPWGANGSVSGFLERRLTPTAVDVLVAAFESTGLFTGDVSLTTRRDRPCGCSRYVELLVDGRLIEVSWSDWGYAYLDGEPGSGLLPGLQLASREQADALEHLESLLTVPPASWLPQEFYVSERTEAYVAPWTTTCFGVVPGGEDIDDPAEAFPRSAREIFGTGITPPPSGMGGFPAPDDDVDEEHCVALPTDEARRMASSLDVAGFIERDTTWTLTYAKDGITVSFLPILPHWTTACTSCG